MTTLSHRNTAITALLFCMSLALAATTAQEFATDKAQVKSAYKADSKLCENLKGNAREVCKTQAKGKANIAQALAEYNNSGKPADAVKLAIAQAKALFTTSTEFCDEKTGNARSTCRSDAKNIYDKALADAKARGKAEQS